MALVDKEVVKDHVVVTEGGTVIMQLRKGHETVLTGIPDRLTADEFTRLMKCITGSVTVYSRGTNEVIKEWDGEKA